MKITMKDLKPTDYVTAQDNQRIYEHKETGTKYILYHGNFVMFLSTGTIQDN